MLIQDIKRKNNGSALILVIIVTVLLSVVGIMFVMTMRMREMTTANVTDDRDLDTAVAAVTEKIGTVLRQDLFGTNLTASILSNEPYDSTTNSDSWLASLEPKWLSDNGTPANPTDDMYQWDQMTKLYGTGSKWDRILRDGLAGWPLPQYGGIVKDYQDFGQCPTKVVNGITVPDVEGFPADADGDGVADSMWERVSGLSTSRSKPVYAAVRIIDNCAMLNLNTAYCYYQKPYGTGDSSPFTKSWYMNSIAYGGNVPYGDDPVTAAIERDYTVGGRYLSELNYYSFLRGSDLNSLWGGSAGDGWYNILTARKFNPKPLTSPAVPYTPQEVHELGIMQIENLGPLFSKFDIGDELEIRNRFIMTSLTESRIERFDVANFSLDAGGGVYAALQIPRDNSGGYPISDWTVRMNAANFDLWRQDGTLKVSTDPDYSDSYRYDRRHVCTFYSFDRNIRSGSYTQLDNALNSLPASLSALQKQAIEELFRPLNYHPIDLRTITDPANPDNITANTPGSRRNILHLLYAFREYCFDDIEGGFSDPSQIRSLAARKAAQIVANMIDYLDDPDATTGPFADPSYGLQASVNPTYINKTIIDTMILQVSGNDPAVVGNAAFDFGLAATDTVYGYERQPFISEVYCFYDSDATPLPGAQAFALELINPYKTAITLNGWRLCFGTSGTSCTLGSACTIPAALPGTQNGRLIIWTADTAGGYSVPAITTDATYNTIISPTTANGISNNTFGLGTPMQLPKSELQLQRPDPANPGQFLTVDTITDAQREYLATCGDTSGCHLDTSRKDTAWGFVNHQAYPGSPSSVTTVSPSLGDANIGVSSVPQKGYQLPVADAVASLDRLADFQKIMFVGNGNDPNCITSLVADAYTKDGESDIRFDYLSFPPLLKYLCTLNRPEGNLPGRININTAPVHVIAAAIPPQLANAYGGDPNDALYIARQIVTVKNKPYKDLGELLTKVPAMKKYDIDPGAPNVGDPGIRHDFEERDWILNRLSNIFTVRSDTFTAYILVRLGTDGPQRRMIAIFDRSNCWTKDDKPRLVALHPVPDPR
jgi:hypothetical protein